MKFNNFSKVIAIKDAPIVNSKEFGNGIQAYKKGDIFEVISTFGNEIVVWQPLVGSTMALNSDNFDYLRDFRDRQINNIL